MNIEAAVIKEQGQRFTVVIVKSSVLDSSSREDVRHDCSRYFPGMPIILMAQDSRGRTTYHGRPDIVRFLAAHHVSQLPWKRYTFTN
jgi:hypothetical protein